MRLPAAFLKRTRLEGALPLVYKELRRVAHQLMGQLRPGQTLQTTALVHEAYLRVAGSEDPGWDGRRRVSIKGHNHPLMKIS